MRAHSIRQPYAELILGGTCGQQIKPIEFRSRPTRIIGERSLRGAAVGGSGCWAVEAILDWDDMNTLAEIESAVAALQPAQQAVLLEHLTERVRKQGQAKGQMPVVAATGREITQEEIDDACDAA